MIRMVIVGAGWAWLLAAGCSMAPNRPADALADGQDLPVIRELAGTHSAFAGPVRLMVHDPALLAELPLNLGPVDFDRYMVLIAALGPTPTDQYGISIRRVWRDGDVLRAQVETRYPPQDAPPRASAASPFHAVVVPRCDLNVLGFAAVYRPESHSGDRAPRP